MQKLLLFCLLFPLTLWAQNNKYNTKTESGTFPDGIYLSFDQLKSGKPGISASEIQLRTDKKISIRQWFRSDSLLFVNTAGKICTIHPDSVYAFIDDHDIFIQRKGFAHKLSIFGSLCYFTETYPVRNAPLSPVTIDRSKDVIPRMLDFESGELLPYSIQSMEEFLQNKDETLYSEYTALESQKLKRQLLIRYIEKFNERHPVNTAPRL